MKRTRRKKGAGFWLDFNRNIDYARRNRIAEATRRSDKPKITLPRLEFLEKARAEVQQLETENATHS